jgi:2-polyprenyl-3-methyl-5-hydroxy-6-metoxy-1,4-benzoquinol methylase
MARCPQCSLVHTVQRDFRPEQYDEIYSSMDAYREMMVAAQKTAAGEFGLRELWWYKRLALRWLEAATRAARSKSLLDVGCGPGTFLLVARQRGWTVAGVEPSREAAELGKSFGLAVHCGFVEEVAEQSVATYDAVACFEVLEHVSQPMEMLSAMCKLLKADGTMVLSVPNLDDPYCLMQQIGPAMPPVHINFFNRQSMTAVLARAGFEVSRFKSLPIPTSSVRNIYGKRGFLYRIPLLAVRRLLGRADGTTLIVEARGRANASPAHRP